MRLGVSKPRLPILQKGHPLAQGLVGAWLAYEGAGATARDVSGRGNHGALQSGVTWDTGRDGQMLNFDGTANGYANAGSGDSLNLSNQLSIVARVRSTNFHDSNNYILSRRNTSDGTGYAFEIQSADSAPTVEGIVVTGGGNVIATGSTVLSVDTWYDLAFTYDGTTGRVYVNGEEDGSDTNAVTLPDQSIDVIIGVYNNLGTVFMWIGNMALVKVYSRALPASQIRALHADPYAAFRYQPRFWQVILDVAALPQRRRYKIVSGDAIVGSSVVRDKSN